MGYREMARVSEDAKPSITIEVFEGKGGAFYATLKDYNGNVTNEIVSESGQFLVEGMVDELETLLDFEFEWEEDENAATDEL